MDTSGTGEDEYRHDACERNGHHVVITSRINARKITLVSDMCCIHVTNSSFQASESDRAHTVRFADQSIHVRGAD